MNHTAMPSSAALAFIRVFAISIAVLALLAACLPSTKALEVSEDESLARDSAAWAQTDRLRYSLEEAGGHRLPITIEYENRSAGTVHLPPCGSALPRFELDRQVAGAWEPAYQPACIPLLREGVRLAPGEVWRTTIQIHVPPPRGEWVIEAATIPGVHRVRIAAYERMFQDTEGTWRLEGPLPVEHRTSNPFEIVP